MEDTIRQILKNHNIQDNKTMDKVISKLLTQTEIQNNIKLIIEAQNTIMHEAIIYKEREEFADAFFPITNAHSKKKYEFVFPMEQFPNIRIKNISGLDLAGLNFEENSIKGIPFESDTYDLKIEFFHINDEENSEFKKTQLFVNADPKDLWKNIPSDKEAPFHKVDEAMFKGSFSDKKIVVASQRGRSHAHEAKFRDDDFAVHKLPDSWNIISVSDGAGSAQLARYGSELATQSINEFFNNKETLAELDIELNEIFNLENENSEAKQNVIKLLYQGVSDTFKTLKEKADEYEVTLKDLHSTLIFALVKKFDFGYVILSFGVGDCPINLINEDFSEVKLLNTMDVGEFGGGTRFITMNEIFDDTISSRFKITHAKDFSKLVLMTDGIYDPKFITENKLEDIESWRTFFEDLNGKNDDEAKVDFQNDETIDEQLLSWMDFWSKGNHDDRTLAVIY
ncbi:PP2C family serine/threonine-protein phosphatase [Chryseobacterium sp. NKUCC03_KSP]|uniref:PP2C family serine/threonine-protein phosphatase n=1 Tax=Chryseobacterium sp. NKUCC03_KSP TaxID=2842125 RepID=UPI001C5B737A|nr:PP2C family serine/threonine-protein phosphatase [Chryseobacterium sp. NKUCC03_KSP]MBW3522644.1 protein phosphatase 2C domain-containing protein [Chryseobacterium sp. NKUCC03_KSP]